MDSPQKNLDLGIICSAMVIVAMSAFADAVQLMCSIMPKAWGRCCSF
jgi:hypothetical protein